MVNRKLPAFERTLKEELRKVAKKIYQKVRAEMVSLIKDYLDVAVKQSTETYDIIQGQLLGELGLEKAEGKMESVIKHLQEERNIKTKLDLSSVGRKVGRTTSKNPTFKFEYYIDYQRLINIPAAKQRWTAYKRVKGKWVLEKKSPPLPWLKWMLLDGDSVIISTHGVTTTTESKRSRSGTDMIMHKKFAPWRVPEQNSGTEDNNFVTRALDQRRAFFERELLKVYKKAVEEAAKESSGKKGKRGGRRR